MTKARKTRPHGTPRAVGEDTMTGRNNQPRGSLKYFLNKHEKFARNVVKANLIDEFPNAEDGDFLVVLDESGDLKISPSNKVSRTNIDFCLAGIAISGRAYARLRPEWIALKKSLFNLDPDKLFHANEDLRKLDEGGTKTLAGLMKKQRFFSLMARHLLSGAGGENRVVDMTLSTIQFQVRLYINSQKEHWIIEFFRQI